MTSKRWAAREPRLKETTMPMIDVTAVAGTFSGKPELIKDLTAALMRWEQVPNIPWFIDNTGALALDYAPAR